MFRDLHAHPLERTFLAARKARREGGFEASRVLLDEAWHSMNSIDLEDPVVQRLAWRRARAADATGDSPIDALAPLLTAEIPLFDTEPPHAGRRLARRHQDAHGFGHPMVRLLWERIADHLKQDGTTESWVQARHELAWDALATGDTERMDQLLVTLEPFHTQRTARDAAHTRFRAVRWHGVHDRAEEALEELMDAFESDGDADLFIESVAEAAQLGLVSDSKNPIDQDPFRIAYVEALRSGTGWEAVYALALPIGPEWAATVGRSAGRAGAELPGWREAARAHGIRGAGIESAETVATAEPTG